MMKIDGNNMMNLYTRDQKRPCLFSCRWRKTVVTLFFFFLSVGCSVDFIRPASNNTVEYNSNKKAAYYFELMQTSSDLSKTDLHLMAIRALLKEKRFVAAKQHIANLPHFLSDTQQNEKMLILADLAIRQKQPQEIHTINRQKLTKQQTIYFYRIKLCKDKQAADVNAVARDYIKLAILASAKARSRIIEETWQFFKSLSGEKLSKMMVPSNEITLKGWLDLAFAYRHGLSAEPMPDKDTSNASLSEFTDQEQAKRITLAISEWQMQYPTHPASVHLPRELNFGQDNPVQKKGKKVALLLPLQGRYKVFGEAVKAGYMAAARFYPDEDQQDILVLDTTKKSVSYLINEAKVQGVELIVGPLLKDDVAKWVKQSSEIPVLALNKPKKRRHFHFIPNSSTQICYFSLSPENEATDAARHIFKKEGKRQVLIITAKTPLSHRIVAAFHREWKTLNAGQGQIYVQYFDSADKLKEAMNRGMGLAVSGDPVNLSLSPFDLVGLKARPAADFQQNRYLNANDEIDAIYVFATQEELEFIKPMLEMQSPDAAGKQVTHAAQDIVVKSVPPIYTSSRSQIANGSPDYRYEMENVQFSDIPLLVAKNAILSELPAKIQRDYSLARLYAMGIDAWRLANRFEQLQISKKMRLEGLTGTMTISPNCEIDRKLPWRVYKRGKVRTVR